MTHTGNSKSRFGHSSGNPRLGLKVIFASIWVFFSLPVLAQNEVFLTMDPTTTNPTIVSEPSAANVLVFRSLDYVNTPPAPQAYVLIFETGFVGKYQTTGGFTTGNITPIGVMFQSEAGTYSIPGGGPVPTQEVRIKLLTGTGIVHPQEGYKYSVLMGGKVLDPRVVPR